MIITKGFHIHKNGGGLVADTAKVDASVFVGADAKISGNAVVSGDTVVNGNAIVCDNAVVSDHAMICDYAMIRGDAVICDNAWVGGNSVILNSAVICEEISIQDALVKGNELWGIYDSTNDSWVNSKNERFENIIGYEWYTIENIIDLKRKGLFAIPLIKCLFAIPLVKGKPQFSIGIRL